MKNPQTEKTATACQKTPDYDIERWVSTTLANDEASTDRELVEHFMEGGPMPYEQASFYIKQRNDALRSPLKFQLDPYNDGDGDQREKPQGQHSPLPWQTDFAIEATFDDGGRKETVIEIMTNDHGDTPCYATSMANAKLIVASVNNAGKLAEALRQIKSAMEHHFAPYDRHWCIEKAREALAQWEAK